tara:strand:- start:30 stop:1349 length:1320 start_codon:yes stop_codon:yes gene_type:complete
MVNQQKIIVGLVLTGSETVQKKLNKLQQGLSRLSRLSAISTDLDKVNARINRLGKVVDKTTGETLELSQVFNKQLNFKQRQAEIKDFNDRMQRLNALLLGVGLASLFFGMALRNASTNAIKSFFKTFQTVTEGTLEFNQTLGRLNASFEYLKFAIADAFLQSAAGQFLIEMLINIFDFLSGLPPVAHNLFIVLLIVGAVLGFVLMLLGQIGLALLGVVEAAKFFGITSAKAVSILGKLKILAMGILKGFAIAAIVVGSVSLLLKVWNSEGNVFKKILVTAIILIVAMVAIASLLGLAINLPLIAAIALVVSIGLALKLAGKEMKLAFLEALLAINKALIKRLLDPIQQMLDLVNSVTGSNFRVGDTSRYAAKDLSNQIVETRREIQEQRAAKAEQEADTKGSTEKGMIFNIENINANNAEEFLTSLKETSLFNKGAGIG